MTSTYVCEMWENDGLSITMFYPEKVSDALTGVVYPARIHQYPFKVRVHRLKNQKFFQIDLLERPDVGCTYEVTETYRKLTYKGAIRKAERLVRHGINMRGVI